VDNPEGDRVGEETAGVIEGELAPVRVEPIWTANGATVSVSVAIAPLSSFPEHTATVPEMEHSAPIVKLPPGGT